LGLIRSDWPRSQLIGPNRAWSGVSPKSGPDFGEHQSRQNWQKLWQENQQNCHFPNFCEVSLLAWPWFNLKYCNIWYFPQVHMNIHGCRLAISWVHD
jgi:hypothetical protein